MPTNQNVTLSVVVKYTKNTSDTRITTHPTSRNINIPGIVGIREPKKVESGRGCIILKHSNGSVGLSDLEECYS